MRDIVARLGVADVRAFGLTWDECQRLVVQSDAYSGILSTIDVDDVTKNLTMANDPACLFVDTKTPEGRATGLIRDSVVSCLVLVTVYADAVDKVLGTLSPAMKQKLSNCLKAALELP